MHEFVAIGPQGSQRWKKPLVEDKVIRLGRAPATGFAVPWDMRISREHCDILLKGNRLYVRCLATALNPAHRLGERVREFSIGVGEDFRIGETTFRLDVVESMQTLDDIGEDAGLQYELRRAAGESQKKAVRRDHLVRNEFDAIRGQISEMNAQLHGDARAKRPSSEAERESRADELDALEQQIEALKQEILAGHSDQESAEAAPARLEKDEGVKALQSEVDRLRAQLAALDAAMPEKTAEPHDVVDQPASEKDQVSKQEARLNQLQPADAPISESEASEHQVPADPFESLKAHLAQQAASNLKKPRTEEDLRRAHELPGLGVAERPGAEWHHGLDGARELIWRLLPDAVQSEIAKIANGRTPDEAVQRRIIDAVNALIKRRDVLASPFFAAALNDRQVQKTVDNLPSGAQGVERDWSPLDVRSGMRAALSVLYPSIPKYVLSFAPRRVLSYLSRGDIFGEMGVILNQPRSATCVAYELRRDSVRGRSTRVEFVRIPAEAFKELLARSPRFRLRVEEVVERRKQHEKKVSQQPRVKIGPQAESSEFRQLGLVQGQSLLLIDLDRCTRCGECVQACINTHDDGFSRLHLEGPRFDRFLVPDACRKCLNPMCMTSCPVGSIQRGSDGQILIRDWCIGCGMCEQQCPFDAIYMHDIGLVPEASVGWRYAPASMLKGDAWHKVRFNDRKWVRGATPFIWNLDMQAEVAARSNIQPAATLREPLCFRHRFRYAGRNGESRRFRLIVKTGGHFVSAWINGQWVHMEPRQTPGEFAGVVRREIHDGDNVLAAKVDPPVEEGRLVMSLRLDALPEIADVGHETVTDVKLVTDTAVVCDLCHSLRGGPACVTQCPHDAAIRIDARYEFPTLADSSGCKRGPEGLGFVGKGV